MLKFEAVNGFLNVFLQNDQFMDRVQLLMKKKHLTYKEGEFSKHHETEEAAFVVIIALYYTYLDSTHRVFGILLQGKIWDTKAIWLC